MHSVSPDGTKQVGCDENMYLAWINLLGNTGSKSRKRDQLHMARRMTPEQHAVLERALLQFPRSAALWQMRLASVASVASSAVGSSKARVKKLFRRALQAVGPTTPAAGALRQQYIDFQISIQGSRLSGRGRRRAHQCVEDLFKEALLESHGSCLRDAAEHFLRWALSSTHLQIVTSEGTPTGGAAKRARQSTHADNSDSDDSDSSSSDDDSDNSDDGSPQTDAPFQTACAAVIHAISSRRDISTGDAFDVYTTLLHLHATAEPQKSAASSSFRKRVYEAAVGRLGDSDEAASMWLQYMGHDALQAARGDIGSRTTIYQRARRALSGVSCELFTAGAALL